MSSEAASEASRSILRRCRIEPTRSASSRARRVCTTAWSRSPRISMASARSQRKPASARVNDESMACRAASEYSIAPTSPSRARQLPRQEPDELLHRFEIGLQRLGRFSVSSQCKHPGLAEQLQYGAPLRVDGGARGSRGHASRVQESQSYLLYERCSKNSTALFRAFPQVGGLELKRGVHV